MRDSVLAWLSLTTCSLMCVVAPPTRRGQSNRVVPEEETRGKGLSCVYITNPDTMAWYKRGLSFYSIESRKMYIYTHQYLLQLAGMIGCTSGLPTPTGSTVETLSCLHLAMRL